MTTKHGSEIEHDDTIKRVSSVGGLFGYGICEGEDKRGPYVAEGREAHDVLCIMCRNDEAANWDIYKVYKADNLKIRKRARHRIKKLMREYDASVQFKIETIWETIPYDKWDRKYYETVKEAEDAARERRRDLWEGRW